MELGRALDWITDRTHCVLITLRADGRAQSSDVLHLVRDDGTLWVSVTDDRAKTANMRRDDRVVVHVTEPSTWSYVSLDCTAELSPVAATTDDATVDLLVQYYRSANGEHEDWRQYRQAMVDEGRLIVTLTPTSAVGQING